MKKRLVKKDNTYDLIMQSGSKWIRVEKDSDFFALCMDKESAFQVIFQDIVDGGEDCEYLSIDDFERVR